LRIVCCDDSHQNFIFWQHWLQPPSPPGDMDIELSFWEELIFSISFALGFITDVIVRTSLWRFCATHLGPFENLPIAASLRAAPRPRPRARKRALTLPLPSLSAFDPLSWLLLKQPVTADQTPSAFLTKLPRDVRTIIYEVVLGGKGFHLSCGHDNSPPDCFICHRRTLLFGSNGHSSCHTKKEKNLLPLLLTCRQMYAPSNLFCAGPNIPSSLTYLPTL
jgi:hypothetical protein